MPEVSVEDKDEDQLFRRSSRKRRKINYKGEKQLRVIVNKKEEQTDGKPKKRGRPRKKDIVLEDADDKTSKCQAVTPIKKQCRKFKLDEIDLMIEEYIKLGDEDGMKRIVNSLQCALQRTPKKNIVSVNTCSKNNGDADKGTLTPVKQKPNTPVDAPRNLINTNVVTNNSKPQNVNPVNLQTASSIPANLHTKSMSVHGNSVIMQGVIDTGMAQTSCFLIPIDIGNIAQIPGGVQVLQSPPGQVIGAQHQVINAPPGNMGNSGPVLIPISQQPPSVPPPQPQFHPQNHPAQISPHSAQITSNIAPITTSNNCAQTKNSTNIPYTSVVNSTNTTIPSSNGVSLMQSSSCSNSVTISNVNQPTPLASAPAIIEEEVSVSGPVNDTIEVSVADTSVPKENGLITTPPDITDTTDPVDAAVDSVVLQSSDSLSKMLDELSHDDMLSIINVLTNTPQQPATSTSTSLPASSSDTMSTDLAKLASDIDKISKLEPDQLSNGVVNQLAAEISKLLSSTAPDVPEGSQDKMLTKLLNTAIQEEDEDFQHVQILQQPPEEINTSAGLKCYMCGLVCPDERAFITHMRFHLFNYRYSCYECGFGTSSMNELLLHKAEEHEGDLTKISPDLLKQLPKSERTPIPDLEETLIQCPECKENIPLNSLSAHMNQKHKPLHKASPGRKPKCTICTALVENKLELAAHVKHHGKEDNCFACYFCPQTYSSISSLQLHTTNYHASLAAKRHYKCTQCAREFSGSYHLIRHVKTVHEQRRDYQCSKCDKSFVELHCLRRHIRNIHNLIRDHTCPVCNRGFTYRQDMFRHIMSVHQKIRDIKCPLCGEKFYHRYFIGHAYRQHDLKVKYRDGICYIYDDAGNVIHKIT